MTADLHSALTIFSNATDYARKSGFLGEIDWQASRDHLAFSESDLLRESAWVVLCSGFKESIVRKVFNHISLSFCDWESANSIVSSSSICTFVAKASFRNTRKLDAIVAIAQRIEDEGFYKLRSRIMLDPITVLREFPYIGNVTAWHLAKNLGFQVAKPDRHLVRLSSHLGFRDTHHLCAKIAAETGSTIGVVDIILWRYLTDRTNTSILLRRPTSI